MCARTDIYTDVVRVDLLPFSNACVRWNLIRIFPTMDRRYLNKLTMEELLDELQSYGLKPATRSRYIKSIIKHFQQEQLYARLQ